MHVIHTAKNSLAASLVCSPVNHYKCQHNPKQKSREQLEWKMEDKLIIAVANNPALYDQSLFSYRDLNRRAHAWREVAEAVGEAGMNSCVVM